MILKRLKLATSACHTALEDQLPLMNDDLSLSSYSQFVSRFFSFYAPLESQLMVSPHWRSLAFDYTARQKTPRLTLDLLALGRSSAELAATPRCTNLPVLTTPEDLLGCLYVIEGATLGGRIITRQLQTQLGLTPESGGAFFDGYGAQTGSNWKAFCTMLSNHADLHADESRHAAIVAGANRTFETLTHWLFPTSLSNAQTSTTAHHDLQSA
ncbi:heme oxygenase [Oxalobacteraceae bacterium GrIS 2.11]